MDAITTAEITKSSIKVDRFNNIAVLKFCCDVYNLITTLKHRDQLSQILSKINKDESIDAIIILNEPGILGERDYFEFLESIVDHEHLTDSSFSNIEASKRSVRLKELNILNQFIIDVVQFDKLTVTCLNGEIVTPFFGASLATDLRFATEDMCFSLSHKKYNLHPSGALPLFLQQYVGRGRTLEILLTKEKISAQEALEFGLVSEIFPKDDFENGCIMRVKEICSNGKSVIKKTKRLMDFNVRVLRDYFNSETEYV